MNKEVERLLHLMKSYASDNDAQGYLTNSQVKLLLDYINQLETNRDEAIEYIKHSWWLRTDQTYDTSKDLKDWEVKKILEILERGKE